MTQSLPAHIQCFFNPAIYPHPAEQIEMIQTHISWVFLAGEFAYKFKKPVDFGFLDFSTLKKRKKFCKRELELNRRISPEIYLGIYSISRSKDGFQLDDVDTSNAYMNGEVVDYCLKMHRFNQSDLLDERLTAGAFDATWMDKLANDCANFHQSSQADMQIDHISLLKNHIAVNLDAASAHIGSGIDQSTIQRLRDFARNELTRLNPLLAARQSDGFIHHCHGDLHLKNITLIDGLPHLFDCIEFNERFRYTDVAADVAFLAMDLDFHGETELSNYFIEQFAAKSADPELMEMLNFYKCYRTYVRAKIALFTASDPAVDEKTSAACIEQAKKHFLLAEKYAAA